MTRPAAHDPAHDDAADGADGAEDGLTVPMFDEATHLPGHARVAFSPLQFYALSRVQRLDVDGSAEGLWLTEAPCPAVTEKGIAFFRRQFTHERIQPYINGLPNTPQRDLVIRYDRALLARGVLQEVILCERLAGGQVVERLRLRDRERVLAERDVNAALRERERFLAVLHAKITAAQEQQLTLAHGEAALERFREEQAERRQRQRREHPAPMAAKPIRAHSRSDAAARDAETKVHAIADHLAGGTSVDAFDADDEGPSPLRAAADGQGQGGGAAGGTPADQHGPPDPDASGQGATAAKERTRPGPTGATGRRPQSSTVAEGSVDSASPDAAAPVGGKPRASRGRPKGRGADAAAGALAGAIVSAPSPQQPPPSLLQALGGRTGFVTDADE